LVLRYHNMTPPALFAEWDPPLAELLRRGREELLELAPRIRIAICDSEYNAAEARAMGFARAVTVPIVRDPGPLARAPRAQPAFLPAPGAGPVVLFVGRMAPSKGQPAVLATFHILKTYIEPEAHLVLIGGTDTAAMVLDNAELRARLHDGARRRVAAMDPAVTAPAFMRALGSVL